MEFNTSKHHKDVAEPLHKPAVGAVVGKQYCLEKAAQFKLENEVVGKGWTITDSDGALVFRVQGKPFDCYCPKRELVDPAGNIVVQMEQKPWSCLWKWSAFAPGNEEALWTTEKKSWWACSPSMNAYLPLNSDHKVSDYTLSGSHFARKCQIFLGTELAAEVTREMSLKNIFILKSIFNVIVYPGVDYAFIVSLIVNMDKLYIHGRCIMGYHM